MFKDLRSGQQERFRQSSVGAGDGPGRPRDKESLGARGLFQAPWTHHAMILRWGLRKFDGVVNVISIQSNEKLIPTPSTWIHPLRLTEMQHRMKAFPKIAGEES